MAETQRTYAIQGRRDGEAERLRHMVEHMQANKAYVHAAQAKGGDPNGQLLEQFRERFRWYRQSWRSLPHQAVENKLHGDAFTAAGHPPLCVDIELAAVCDLACPFCYRQFVATPDKIMDFDLAIRLIDQAAELGVPSMKFNWRGEPLLHPRLPELVAHAKRRGILETIINTNATTLNEAKAKALIESGLDLIIYSFDGGTQESYERMRPGRFGANGFDAVVENIRRLAYLRTEMRASFPRTKIQMVLTNETFPEQNAFHALFDDCVDDVSVKQYTERGGRLADLDEADQTRLSEAIQTLGLGPDTATMRDKDGALFVATGRLPCEQPYQRLLVTYDGRVSMCCYDWGSMHPVGYVDDLALKIGESEYEKVKAKAESGAKGFEMMTLEMPHRFNIPAQKVESLAQIWVGDEIDTVRRCHVQGRLEEVDICKGCPFKETYVWEKVSG